MNFDRISGQPPNCRVKIIVALLLILFYIFTYFFQAGNMGSSQISNKFSIKYVFLFTFFLVAVLTSLTESEICKFHANFNTASNAENSSSKTGLPDYCFDLVDTITPEFAQYISSIQLPIKKSTIEIYHLDYFLQSDLIHSLLSTFTLSNQSRAPVLRI